MSRDEVQKILGSPSSIQEVKDLLFHWNYAIPETPKLRGYGSIANLSITFEPHVTRISAAISFELGAENGPELDPPVRRLRLKSDLMPHLSLGQSLGLFRGRLPGVTRLEKDEGPFFPPTKGPKFFFSAGGAKVVISTDQNRVTGFCIAESFGEFWPPESSEPLRAARNSTFCGQCFVKIDHERSDLDPTHPCPFGCQDCIHNWGGTYIKSHGLYGE